MGARKAHEVVSGTCARTMAVPHHTSMLPTDWNDIAVVLRRTIEEKTAEIYALRSQTGKDPLAAIRERALIFEVERLIAAASVRRVARAAKIRRTISENEQQLVACIL